MPQLFGIQPPLGFSAAGPRERNEDSICPPAGKATSQDTFFMVCDGVGGALKGELASATACEAFSMYVRGQALPEPVTDAWLQEGLREVEQQFDELFTDQFLLKGMATTLTLLLLHPGGALVAHVGDSRVYQLRAGKIIFQTDDHSFVGGLVRAGELSPEAAAAHPKKNLITRAVQGSHQAAELAVVQLTDIQAGDYFFLCSDGVWECLPDAELAAWLGNPDWTNAEKARHIMARCEEVSRDNYSGYLLQVSEVPADLLTPSPAADAVTAVPALAASARLPSVSLSGAALGPPRTEAALPVYATPAPAAPLAAAGSRSGSGGRRPAVWLGLLGIVSGIGFWSWSHYRGPGPAASPAAATSRQRTGQRRAPAATSRLGATGTSSGLAAAAPGAQPAQRPKPATLPAETDAALAPPADKKEVIAQRLALTSDYGLNNKHLQARNLEQQANANQPEAMFLLGRAYETGALGLPLNLREARNWYEKASRAKSRKASQALKRLLLKTGQPALPAAGANAAHAGGRDLALPAHLAPPEARQSFR